MAIEMLWQKTAVILIYMSLFELLLISIFTAIASWRLSVILGKHDSRMKEAKLARKIAAFYAALAFVFWGAARFLQ